MYSVRALRSLLIVLFGADWNAVEFQARRHTLCHMIGKTPEMGSPASAACAARGFGQNHPAGPVLRFSDLESQKSEVRILWPRSRTSLSCVTGCIWMHCIRCGQVCPSCGGPARPAILMFGALSQVRKIDCKILTSQSFDPCVLIRTDISFDVLTLFDIVHGRNVSNHLKWCKQWLIDDDRC